MQLTKFSDYALRTLMYVAQRPKQHITIAQIAHSHEISESHLMKVVSRLANLGYLATTRGKGGGIALGHLGADISIGAVVRAIEPLAMAECLAASYDSRCQLSGHCRLSAILGAAQQSFLATLDQYTLADISGSERRSSVAP